VVRRLPFEVECSRAAPGLVASALRVGNAADARTEYFFVVSFKESDMFAPRRRHGLARIVLILAMLLGALSAAAGKGKSVSPPLADTPTPIQIFGVWHCGNHYCDWNETIDMTEFDRSNRWLLERSSVGAPSVNLVVLSFVNPLKMLNSQDDGLYQMIPRGMTREVVDYFKSAGIRVMLSIGGITYTDDWDAALLQDAARLGRNAAFIAQYLGVGIEIDYENSSSPNIAALAEFIAAYRSVHPYDATGLNPAARLTIDVAAGDRWLIELNRYATQHWLDPANAVLDYANAMVGGTSSGTPTDWQEHVDGKPQYAPPVLPLAPARFTGALYLKGNSANCLNFGSSEQKAYADYVQRVLPNAAAFPVSAGFTPGMLGYMFWAAGTPSARRSYVPTTDCTGGVGAAAEALQVPLPMPPLRPK
jgi:hypothetical protein